jgi:hypothetical protein
MRSRYETRSVPYLRRSTEDGAMVMVKSFTRLARAEKTKPSFPRL